MPTTYKAAITPTEALAAMDAASNINILGAFIALCENSLLRGARAQRVEHQIVRICKAEQQAQLRLMDKATGRKD